MSDFQALGGEVRRSERGSGIGVQEIAIASEEPAFDTAWLSQATKAITANWKAKNSRKTEHLEQNQALAA